METYKTPPNFMYIINPLQPYIEYYIFGKRPPISTTNNGNI